MRSVAFTVLLLLLIILSSAALESLIQRPPPQPANVRPLSCIAPRRAAVANLPGQVDTNAVQRCNGLTDCAGKWNATSLVVSHRRTCRQACSAIRMSSGAVLVLAESLHFRCERQIGCRRRAAAWRTAPTSRSTLVETSQRASAR